MLIFFPGAIFGHCLRSYNWTYVNKEFAYSHDKLIKAPLLEDLNNFQLPSPEWNFKLSQFLDNNSFSKLVMDVQFNHSWTPSKVLNLAVRDVLFGIFSFMPGTIRAEHLLDYAATFIDKKFQEGYQINSPEEETVVTSTRDLDHSKSVVSIEAFSEYRLSGPNSTSVNLCTSKTLLYRLGIGKDPEILNLLKAKKLFYVDHNFYADIPPSNATLDDFPKHSSGSIALFKLDDTRVSYENKHKLKPVCVQVLGQKETAKTFFPGDGIKWKIAKTVFQSNDAVYQAIFAHLAERTWCWTRFWWPPTVDFR